MRCYESVERRFEVRRVLHCHVFPTLPEVLCSCSQMVFHVRSSSNMSVKIVSFTLLGGTSFQNISYLMSTTSPARILRTDDRLDVLQYRQR